MEESFVIRPADNTVPPGLLGWVKAIYALHAVAIAMGIFGQAFIVTMFVFGLPSIIAVIISYAKRADAAGTWLASHVRWLIRTFWKAFIAIVLIWVVFGPLSLILIGIPFLIGGLIATGIWAIYRIVRGWLLLSEGRPAPNGGS